MVSSLLLVSFLTLGQFPEVPVGPPPLPPPEEAPLLPPDQAAPEHSDDEAARERAALEEADPTPDDDDWAEEKKRASSAPPFQIRALATTTIRMSLRDVPSSGDWLFGVRAELDIGYASALFSWDHATASLFDLSAARIPTSYWNAVLGPTVWATRHNRIRLLGGLSAVSSSGTGSAVINTGTTGGDTVRATRGVQFGPTLGTTVHLGIHIISVEAAVLYTPIGFRQVDARGEVVLRVFVIELRGGYRARWVDSSQSATEVPVEPIYGPTVSLGLVF